jgi:hypothetical protein
MGRRSCITVRRSALARNAPVLPCAALEMASNLSFLQPKLNHQKRSPMQFAHFSRIRREGRSGPALGAGFSAARIRARYLNRFACQPD